ncbi:MAG: glycosyl hydrolase family 65 protein [Clostridiales bacterium]|nr:glycosyl hydrolase family 65 protein [Clostridiales bacterium]
MNKAIYPFEEWKITENEFDIGTNYRDETIFSLGNGYFGTRGTFEEGYSGRLDTTFNATYINGFYEIHGISYPEGGYGLPDIGQTMINVADGKIIKLFICGERFDLLKGKILSYERTLYMKYGYLERKIKWESPGKKIVEINIKRLISLTRQHLGVIIFTVKPINFTGDITFISEVNGDIVNNKETKDVRVGNNISGRVLETFGIKTEGLEGWILQGTKRSKLKYACSYDHEIISDDDYDMNAVSDADLAGVKIDVDVSSGREYTLIKYISYYTSRECTEEELISNALNEVKHGKNDGPDVIFREQKDYLNKFWDDADIIIDGNTALQQGIRFNEFQLLQSVGRSDITNICAKGLTGEGYEGHYFWDSDVYIMPFFLYTVPDIARNFVMFRYNLLDAARKRAKELGYKGALYPWRTIDGPECSAFFPAGTAQYHIDSDIVLSVKKYVEATLDYDFLYKYGAEIVFETARLWLSIGSYIPLRGNKFCINCVTGPDEYTALVDNNAYTNYMAKMNLEYACEIAKDMKNKAPEAYRKVAEKIALTQKEIDAFADAAQNMYLPYSEELSIIPQDDTFIYKKRINADDIPQDEKPILLHRHYLNIYRYQICKQPDVLLLMYLRGELFSKDELKKNYDYYEPITTHDSSLSSSIFSILANDIGYFSKAYRYFMMTSRMDLDDYNGNVKDGIHTACMAGAWSAVISGFGGMKVYSDGLHFTPALPKEWNSLSFKVKYRNCRLYVRIDDKNIIFKLLDGSSLDIYLYDDRISLENGERIIKEVL